MNSTSPLLPTAFLFCCIPSLIAQELSSVEAVEYESNSDRWLVSNGSSILVTDNLGETWTALGSGGATHGMEVLGSTVCHPEQRHSCVRRGERRTDRQPVSHRSGLLNGMGSESTDAGDILIVSDFSSGRILKVDVSDPANMTYSTLVADTGTAPNGVTVLDGVATLVNWGGNSDILQIDVETGEMTVLVDGTGLGNCDGVDWANGSLIVSSWTPQRITQFSPDTENPGAWMATTLINGAPLSNPADLSVNTLGDTYGVACSGNNTVYFGPLLDISAVSPVRIPVTAASLTGEGLALSSEEAGQWMVRGLDASGRELGTNSLSSCSGQVPVSWDVLGSWSEDAFLLEVRFEPMGSASGSWRTVLKHGATR